MTPSAEVALSTDPNTEQQSYWIVPNRRVHQFVGREAILMKVQDCFKLDREEKMEPRVVVLRAMGGQGKTQVALELCNRAKKMKLFKGIFWIDATSKNTASKSFDAISRRIFLPSQFPQQDALVECVKEKLAEWPEPWLLVFDNYDNPDAFFFTDYKPSGGLGCVLITTRHVDVDDCATTASALELPPFSQDEAVALLMKCCQKEQTEDDLNSGKAIVKRLGCHPLAITQAVSAIAT